MLPIPSTLRFFFVEPGGPCEQRLRKRALTHYMVSYNTSYRRLCVAVSQLYNKSPPAAMRQTSEA
jgi:hypothetical protein